MSRHRILSFLVLVSISLITLGCSTGSPTAPSNLESGRLQADRPAIAGDHGRWNWGHWELTFDLESGTVFAEPLRSAEMHFNVVPLLNDGTPDSLLGFSNLLVDGTNHTLQVDISLTHPFPDLPQVPGFDVHGILFTKGNAITLYSANAVVAGPNEPRLINADGYTRWWNPTEFVVPGMFGYIDGAYGSPHLGANYEINLAGYKYFANGLGATESLTELDVSKRGTFLAGSTNRRRYLIDFGDDPANYLKFNYAVDANWAKATGFKPGDPGPIVPDDFPLTANCPEPYGIRVTETMNTLSATSAGGTGGTLMLNIDVFDWQALDPLSTVPVEVSTVQVDCPAFGLGPINAAVVPGSDLGGHMSTYTATLTGSSLYKLDTVDFFVVATMSGMDYQNDLTNYQGADPLQAYFLYSARVLDADVYAGWTYRYTRLLYPEYPNQGDNPPDIAVYKKNSIIRAAMVDQVNEDPNHDGVHRPDSINEWTDDYLSYSLPEHYHLPLGGLSFTGRWDDIDGICVSDSSTRFFFCTTNIFDEFASPGFDPLFCFLTWSSHTYLGNQEAAAINSVFFSDGDYPRLWCTDPSNGVTIGNDYIYSVFLYDVTDLAGGDPGVDPQRYVIFRWEPPYEATTDSADWQRPLNVPPNGDGTGFVDRSWPYNHRLAVDDSTILTRCYILDSYGEVEVVDCDFTTDEYSGSYPVGTVTIPNHPAEVTGIVDLEVVQTKQLGEPRNYVAALCRTTDNHWRVWVFDYDPSQPLDSQAVTQWLSDEYEGEPCSLDAADGQIEVHVLHKNGGLVYVSVFRDYP